MQRFTPQLRGLLALCCLCFGMAGTALAQPAGLSWPIELRADDKPAFAAPPAGWDQRREGAPRGRLEIIEYDSRTVGTSRRMQVYTPPGYSAARRYPVLYLLHGIGGDETEWQRFAAPDVLLDRLLADGLATPMIVVMPNGRAQADDRSPANPFAAASAFARFERDLLDDVIPAIEARYSVAPGREQRALAGLSMGGGQALNFGLAHTDRFAWVGGFSAAPNTHAPTDLLPDADALASLRLLWLSCGSRDGLLRVSQGVHEQLKARGVAHVWHVTDHGHDAPEWRQALYHFAQQLFKPAPPKLAPAAAQTGNYRNLLRELRPAITEQHIDAKLAAYWRSLFEGAADQRIYYPAAATPDGPAAYILDVGNADVRSEGMSYGLMMAVQMGRKAEFDALWNWAATHMRYATGPRAGYFRWRCLPSGCPKDEVPASDGEEYIATALLMAAGRWGSGQGLYDYRAQAHALLDMMLHKEAKNGGVVEGARNIFSTQHGQVVFVPVGTAAEFSDPSYHLPAFYELWARRGPAADRQRWTEIAQISRAYFDKAAHPKTGLTPDYAEFDGRPRVLEGHEDFRYDAFRTAMNWAVDQAWWGRNPAAAGLSHRLLSFFAAQGPGPYPHLYRIDGKPLNDEAAKGLIATNAVAALLVDPALAERFVLDLWALEPPSGQWRYYDGLLQFMAMLHVSGRFRAY